MYLVRTLLRNMLRNKLFKNCQLVHRLVPNRIEGRQKNSV